MKFRTKTVAYGLAGLAVAGAMIFSGTTLGLLTAPTSGVLSILLTDPPSVPDGVTAVYLTYTGVAVHPTGFADSEWISIAGQGTIDTMQLVNLTQTISSGDIPALTYNQVRFTISNASVEFMGKNYSAALGSDLIEVPIAGGLKVNSSGMAATLIDIQPTVVNVGDRSQPSFTIAAGARALQVPPTEVDQSTHVVGDKVSLQGHGWFDTFVSRNAVNLTLSGISLSPNSFSFSATNGGDGPLTMKTIVIAPHLVSGDEGAALGSVVNGAFFSVQGDGSLTLLGGQGAAMSAVEGSGFSLASGSTQGFSFAGAVTNPFGNMGIVSGDSYYVIVIGPGTLCVQTVAAS